MLIDINTAQGQRQRDIQMNKTSVMLRRFRLWQHRDTMTLKNVSIKFLQHIAKITQCLLQFCNNVPLGHFLLKCILLFKGTVPLITLNTF